MTSLQLGHIVGTPAALTLLDRLDVDPFSLLARHATGDWGDLDAHDTRANNHAAGAGGGRILSSYDVSPTEKVWVITERDRSSTCILTPGDY